MKNNEIKTTLNFDEILGVFEKMKTDDVDKRKEYNLKIVALLGEFFEANPHMRFEQGLYVLLNDYTKFSRESRETLRIIEHYKERNQKQFIIKEEEK